MHVFNAFNQNDIACTHDPKSKEVLESILLDASYQLRVISVWRSPALFNIALESVMKAVLTKAKMHTNKKESLFNGSSLREYWE